MPGASGSEQDTSDDEMDVMHEERTQKRKASEGSPILGFLAQEERRR